MSKSPQQFNLEDVREIFEEIDEIIIVIDKKGEITYVNRALRRHLGYRKKRFTGLNVNDCGLFSDRLSSEEIIKRIFGNRAFHSTAKTAQRTNKTLSWKTKTFEQGKQRMVLATIRDISAEEQRKRKVEKYAQNLQEMVFQRTQEIEKEKQKALELHQAKAIFLSRMSHEMRTPLTAIRGYAEVLQDQSHCPTEKKSLRIIERNAERLLEMINETLDMVKLEQNKYQIQERPFNLQNELQEIIDTYRVLAEEKGLELEYSLREDIPQTLYSDPNAVRQILTNLIGNALKFTKEGRIKVRVKMRSFKDTMAQKLYFYIEDSGIGIPKEAHKSIFRSFEQYLGNQDVHHPGTGLGLSISRQLARLLGGQVKLISSVPNKGSTFVFSLPIRKAPK